MPFRNYRKSSKKVKKSFRGKRSAKPRGVTSTVKSYVKKMIHSQIENKIMNTVALNIPLIQASGSIYPTVVTLVPPCAIGTATNNRIGNEITIVKATIKGYCNNLYYNATTNPSNCPTYVKMWLCRRKTGSVEISGVPSTANFNNFFQSGATSLPFQSNMLDMCLRNNKDYWTVLTTKTFQIANCTTALGYANYLVPGSSKVSQPFSFSFAKHIGKLKYNDSYGNIATNKELFLVFQTVASDGSSTASQSFAEIHYNIEWEFEDA